MSDDAFHFMQEPTGVVVYCYGIAQMLGHDLDHAIEHKMREVFRRTYHKEDCN